MYLHLGQNTVVNKNNVVGIFDLDGTTVSVKTRNFLRSAEKSGNVFNVSDELPKSFVICEENGKTTVYISQMSAYTLLKRFSSKEV